MNQTNAAAATEIVTLIHDVYPDVQVSRSEIAAIITKHERRQTSRAAQIAGKLLPKLGESA
jgi:hypothetical protein